MSRSDPQYMLTTARRLVSEFDLSVIPLRAKGKRPDGSVLPVIGGEASWAPFQERHASDDELRQWFDGSAGAERNIGIVTGQVSGIVVVDVDGPDAEAFAKAHLPDTPIKVTTGKIGGQHLYFRHPGDGEVRNAVKIRVAGERIAFDVRADGGYVCGPTSIHESGREYRALAPWADRFSQMPVFDRAWLPREVRSVSIDAPLVVPMAVRNDREQLLRRARLYVDRVDPAIEGQGGDVHTFKLCCRLKLGFCLSDSEALEVLRPWNAGCVPPWTERELEDKLRGAEKYGREPIGGLADAPAPHVISRSLARTATTRELAASSITTTAGQPVLVRMADVQPEEISWIWPSRVARKKINLIAGDPGLGKSTITIDVTARVSRGLPWPDGGVAPIGDVVILTAEDGLADTLRPRLDLQGADVARVHVLSAVRGTNGIERSVSLVTDVGPLEQAIQQTRAVLVVIDPISAYLGMTNSYRDAEVRAILAPLHTLAEKTGAAIWGVMHLTKDQQRQALYRPGGSIGFVGAARLTLAVGVDPDDATRQRRFLMPVKENICAPAATLAYRMALVGDRSRLTWEAAAVEGIDVNAVLSPQRPQDADERHEAEMFLRDQLSDGPTLETAVRKAAEAQGISYGTLRRAKRSLRVESERVGFGPTGKWYWSLPKAEASKVLTEEPGSPKALISEEVSTYGETYEKGADFTDAASKALTEQDVSTYGADQPPLAIYGDQNEPARGGQQRAVDDDEELV